MRVEPEFLDHPKLLRLKKRVGDFAVEGVLRLWGHCQNSQRGGTWKNADSEYIEVVARWAGEPGVFFTALKEVRFVEERPAALVIHDWDTFNSKARANWKNGLSGGRPKGNPTLPQQNLDKPNQNPNETQNETGKPSANLRVSQSVSQSVSGTGDNNNGAVAPNGSAVAASRTQFAALAAEVQRLEAEKPERGTDAWQFLRKKKRALEAFQKKQAAGEF